MSKSSQGGRPTDFNKDIANFIKHLAQEGLTDAQIAKEVGISRSTLSKWKNDFPEFSDTLKEAKATPDEEVERSLFRRAMGYSCKEVKVFFDKDSGTCVEHEVIKHYPPDVVACIFWLKNRQPGKWREKVEDTGQGKDNTIKLAYPRKGEA